MGEPQISHCDSVIFTHWVRAVWVERMHFTDSFRKHSEWVGRNAACGRADEKTADFDDFVRPISGDHQWVEEVFPEIEEVEEKRGLQGVSSPGVDHTS